MQPATKVVEMKLKSESKKYIFCSLLLRWLKIESESKKYIWTAMQRYPTHCTMRLALKKHVSIRIGQNDDLGSHFLMPELFQMKIIGSFLLCSFTFNLYLGTS